ncbi:unnamed protein product [Symbiodinium sp. CCMP2592]|nr:unnamed protein product [Symbiodinium sp. CCMP2592]
MDRPSSSKSFRPAAAAAGGCLRRAASSLAIHAMLFGCCWHTFFCFIGSGAQVPGLSLAGTVAAAILAGECRSRSKMPQRVREPRRGTQDSGSPEGEARMLTSRITKTDSAAELLELLGKQEQTRIFNEYHVTASMTKLAKLKRRRQLRQADTRSPVWAKLAARLQDMLQQDVLSPRSTANVFYAVSELYDEMGKHMLQVLPMLSEAVRVKATGMVEQALSNCLLAAGKLHDAAPEVLIAVPELSEQIRRKVASMNSQDLSNCIWASAKLHDASPQVLDLVPALAKRIANKVQDMISQALSNCLWSAAKLQDASPEVLDSVPALAKHIVDKAKSMRAQELSNCLWAAAKLQDASPEVLAAVPALAKHIPDMLDDMVPQALCISFWAAAKLRQTSPEVLDLVPELIVRNGLVVRSFAPEGLRMSLWAAQQFEKHELVAKLQAEGNRRKR